MVLKEVFDKNAAVDIKSVLKEELIEINDVKIDVNRPVKERVNSFIKEIGNPYCFLSNGVVVKIGFNGEVNLEDRIIQFMERDNSHI